MILDRQGKIIDGATRYRAAVNSGLEKIYVNEKSFVNEKQAVIYCLRSQHDRRNITDADIFRLVKFFYGQKMLAGRGRPKKNVGEPTFITVGELKKRLGTYRDKIFEALEILQNKSNRIPTKASQVLSGKKTIHEAFLELKKRRDLADFKNRKSKKARLFDPERLSFESASMAAAETRSKLQKTIEHLKDISKANKQELFESVKKEPSLLKLKREVEEFLKEYYLASGISAGRIEQRI